MEKQEYIEMFRLKLALIPVGEANREGFTRYMQDVSFLRSQSIYELKLLQIPGKIRARYNDSVNHLVPDFKNYLYKINKNCALCGFPMVSIKEVTIDHIVARADGGSRAIENHQLAHAHCNVLKDADFNKRTGQHLRPRTHKKRGK